MEEMTDSQILREILKELKLLNSSQEERIQKIVELSNPEETIRQGFAEYLKKIENEGIIFEMLKEITAEQVEFDKLASDAIDAKVDQVDFEELAREKIDEEMPRDFKPYLRDLSLQDLGQILKHALSD